LKTNKLHQNLNALPKFSLITIFTNNFKAVGPLLWYC